MGPTSVVLLLPVPPWAPAVVMGDEADVEMEDGVGVDVVMVSAEVPVEPRRVEAAVELIYDVLPVRGSRMMKDDAGPDDTDAVPSEEPTAKS